MFWWITRSNTLFPICVQSNKWNYRYKQSKSRQSREWLVKPNRPTCAVLQILLLLFAWNLLASHLVHARLMNNVPYAELVIPWMRLRLLSDKIIIWARRCLCLRVFSSCSFCYNTSKYISSLFFYNKNRILRRLFLIFFSKLCAMV